MSKSRDLADLGSNTAAIATDTEVANAVAPKANTTDVIAKTNGAVTTAATGSTVVRNITLSTADPSGGNDGDVWVKYTA